MSKVFTDKEILDFVENNLAFEKCEVTGAMQLVNVSCDVYGNVYGTVSGNVRYVRGDVGTFYGRTRIFQYQTEVVPVAVNLQAKESDAESVFDNIKQGQSDE